MVKLKTNLSGWGNYPSTHSYISRPEKKQDLKIGQSPLIARGLGRSFSDSALNTERDVLLMERFNCFLSFDEKLGILRAEAGATLEEIVKTFVPRGWFLPVTPSTKYASLGGCFAADVHGKNHLMDGSFSRYVLEIELLLSNGTHVKCSPSMNSELFWATAGGMGLTGVITELTLQLMHIESAFMLVKHFPAKNLQEVFTLMQDPRKQDRYSIAWIDCESKGPDLGRGIMINGHHAIAEELPEKISPFKIKKSMSGRLPFHAPSFVFSNFSIRTFNSLYHYTQTKKTEPFFLDYEKYFYPLDAIKNWNFVFGRKGLLKYQFVVPSHQASSAVHRILEFCHIQKRIPCLGMLKKFGPGSPSYLAFSKEGFSLTLDFSLTDQGIFSFLDRLDGMVLDHEGRVYIAKDSRMHASAFRQMYPRFKEWQNIKLSVDPKQLFSSDLSRRLELTS